MIRVFLFAFLFAACVFAPAFVVIESSSSFAPTDIASLELWLDASDINGNGDNNAGLTDEDVLTGGVQDKSGSNRDAVDPSDYTAPNFDTNIQNSKACIRFTALTPTALEVADADDLSCISGCTIVAVVKAPATLVSSRIISKEQSGAYEWALQLPWGTPEFDDFFAIFFGDGTTNGSAFHARQDSNIIASSTAAILMGYYNGGTAGVTDVKTAFNGTLDTADTTVGTGSSFPPDNTAAKVRLGVRFAEAEASNQEYNGHICEALYFSTDLSSDDKGSVFTYLNSKWAVY